jgi:hypothetical protein
MCQSGMPGVGSVLLRVRTRRNASAAPLRAAQPAAPGPDMARYSKRVYWCGPAVSDWVPTMAGPIRRWKEGLSVFCNLARALFAATEFPDVPTSLIQAKHYLGPAFLSRR